MKFRFYYLLAVAPFLLPGLYYMLWWPRSMWMAVAAGTAAQADRRLIKWSVFGGTLLVLISLVLLAMLVILSPESLI